jgi:hypothetical protein
MEFVFNSPVRTVMPKEVMGARTLWSPAGNAADGLLSFFTVCLSGATDHKDLRSERKIDLRCRDFGAQDAVRLDPAIGFIGGSMGRGKKSGP